ncbi:MAG: hypothetical protein ACFBSF_04690 [Leptolyngbyaceae cyanobacterium]
MFVPVWSDAPRTPRYVWSVSAIAATALHAGGLWWARTYWQSSRDVITPAAIAVIAISESEVGAIAIPPDATDNPLTAPNIPQSAAPNTPPEPLPASNTTSAPAISQPPPSGTVESPNPDPFTPAEPAPVLPQPEPSSPSPAPSQITPPPPSPATQSPSPNTSPSPSPTSPPTDPKPPSPSPPETPDSRPRLFPSLRLEPIPPEYRADSPDAFPQEPSGWQQSVIALIENSACYASLPSAASSQEIIFRLTVEEDGRISNVGLWSSSNEQIGDDLAKCLNSASLKAQIPPLIAATVNNDPIPTDLMLLTLQLSFRN